MGDVGSFAALFRIFLFLTGLTGYLFFGADPLAPRCEALQAGFTDYAVFIRQDLQD